MLKENLINKFLSTVPADFRLIKKENVVFENDEQNQAIEVIDVLHFGLSILMYLETKENILELNDKIKGEELEISEFPIKDILTMKSKLILSALEYNFVETMYCLTELLLVMSNSCNRTIQDIYDGYYKKNTLNAKRIQEGYITGDYKKIDENGLEDNRKLNV